MIPRHSADGEGATDEAKSTGSLVVVGTGIKMAAHITVEAKAWIEQANKVLFLANGPIVAEWVRQLNPKAEDLACLYDHGKRRLDTYKEMVDRILAAVREKQTVCAVFYGHPGVFVLPAHMAVRQAREEGFKALMLPGISAEDCLFADLGIDPAWYGCQSFEAMDFLLRPRRFDTSTGLILWQIGAVGTPNPPEATGVHTAGTAVLQEVLETHYGPDHEVVVYEASPYPGFGPLVQRVPLKQMLDATIRPLSTLYVPPKAAPRIDMGMLDRLGLSLDMLAWDR
jgi:uncharacterized protein YabN with tetrapyrrole methylase and pyrophosphatase domain